MTDKTRKLVIIQNDYGLETLKSVELIQEGIDYSFVMMPKWSIHEPQRVANGSLYDDTIQNRDKLQNEINERHRSIWDFEVGDLVYACERGHGIGLIIKVTPKCVIVDIEEEAKPIRLKKTKVILLSKVPE